MDQQKIGRFIAACRKERGMTQAQLGERLGVSNKAVSKWETGRCLPDVSLFGDICLLLGIALNELFAGERIAQEDMAVKSEENLLSVAAECQRRDHRMLRSLSMFAAGVGMAVASIAIANTLFRAAWAAVALLMMIFGAQRLGGVEGRLFRRARIISLLLLAASFVFAVDLGLNYANALLTQHHDGIVLTGIFGAVLYGDGIWTLPAFFHAFESALVVTAIMALENIALWCVSIANTSRS